MMLHAFSKLPAAIAEWQTKHPALQISKHPDKSTPVHGEVSAEEAEEFYDAEGAFESIKPSSNNLDMSPPEEENSSNDLESYFSLSPELLHSIQESIQVTTITR